MNTTSEKPLYALTVSEFHALTRQIVIDCIKEQLTAIQENENSSEKQNEEEHFTIKELTKYLRCSRMSIYNYKKLGLPFYRLGRKILFKKNEVLEFMRRCFGSNKLMKINASKNPKNV